MKEYTKRVKAFLERHGNEDTAVAMSRVTKYELKFLGIRTIELKELYKTIFLNFPLPKIDDTKNIVREFFAMEEREFLYFATRLFAKRKKLWVKTDIVFIESLILAQPAWDTTEDIASELVAVYAEKFPRVAREFLTSWSEGKNPWLKSAAIMFQRQYKERTDVNLLERFILAGLGTENETLNRAIGAALRDYSKVDHKWVLNFVIQNSSKLDKKSKQEAIKWIDNKGLID